MSRLSWHTLALPLAWHLALPLVAPAVAANWYDDIDGLMVFSPEDDVQSAVDKIFDQMQDDQFSAKRFAVLLRSGVYTNLQMHLGYYTSIIGVGPTRADVQVASFYALDGKVGGATQNFWRSVEGLTATNPSIMWATSQACPLRRVDILGEFWLSQYGEGTHWSSGGFLGDVRIRGPANVGTQQQFAFRNVQFDQNIDVGGIRNVVFVGSKGAPSSTQQPGQVTNIPNTPVVAEKPFLVEIMGEWSIRVPFLRSQSQGIADETLGTNIGMEHVFVAKPEMTAQQINKGIVGKLALLLVPGIYSLSQPIKITKDNFVVLGLGFPTLVPASGRSALVVAAREVRVASVLLEASTAGDEQTTEPLLLWSGERGVLTDIFTRAGSFSYESGLHESCSLTRASVHVQVDGAGVVIDNTWLWHADHDDCNSKSDKCYSGQGLKVQGDDVIAYGVKVEHMMSNLVEWYGEGGQVYFFQSELPYHDADFGTSGFVGYKVDYAVSKHTAAGLGVYIVEDLQVDSGFRAPPNVDMRNLLVWHITGGMSNFRSVICTSPGTTDCRQGDSCDSQWCYLTSLQALRQPSSHLANSTALLV